MAKNPTKLNVETLKHTEAIRKNIPTASEWNSAALRITLPAQPPAVIMFV
jgi:hypothetical protein